MLRSLNEIRGYKILASDGDIGKVDDFLIDDVIWGVRYLVLDTGNWLSGRKVLVSPEALGAPRWEDVELPVSLSKQQIEDSPEISEQETVSRQHERQLHTHYGWVPYWPVGGAGVYGTVVPVPTAENENENEREQTPQSHLRSVKELDGYHVQASDGTIGHIEDFIADIKGWMVRYAVVDTKNWLPGKSVLVALKWVEDVRWDDRKFFVKLTKEEIRHSPEYDPSAAVNREYEMRLYDYYGRPKYWEI